MPHSKKRSSEARGPGSRSRAVDFQLGDLTLPPRKRPSIVGSAVEDSSGPPGEPPGDSNGRPKEPSRFTQIYLRNYGVDTPSRLLGEENEKLETWKRLQRLHGSDWELAIREVQLRVETLHSEFGFSCAVDSDSHKYAITPRSKIDFKPAVGQNITARVRQAFVEEATLCKAANQGHVVSGGPDGL